MSACPRPRSGRARRPRSGPPPRAGGRLQLRVAVAAAGAHEGEPHAHGDPDHDEDGEDDECGIHVVSDGRRRRPRRAPVGPCRRDPGPGPGAQAGGSVLPGAVGTAPAVPATRGSTGTRAKGTMRSVSHAPHGARLRLVVVAAVGTHHPLAQVLQELPVRAQELAEVDVGGLRRPGRRRSPRTRHRPRPPPRGRCAGCRTPQAGVLLVHARRPHHHEAGVGLDPEHRLDPLVEAVADGLLHLGRPGLDPIGPLLVVVDLPGAELDHHHVGLDLGHAVLPVPAASRRSSGPRGRCGPRGGRSRRPPRTPGWPASRRSPPAAPGRAAPGEGEGHRVPDDQHLHRAVLGHRRDPLALHHLADRRRGWWGPVGRAGRARRPGGRPARWARRLRWSCLSPVGDPDGRGDEEPDDQGGADGGGGRPRRRRCPGKRRRSPSTPWRRIGISMSR